MADDENKGCKDVSPHGDFVAAGNGLSPPMGAADGQTFYVEGVGWVSMPSSLDFNKD